jgi:hypothetical protein
MAEVYKKLAQLEVLTGAPALVTPVYTATGVTALIKGMRLVSTDASPRTCKIWHDGAADVNLILPAVTIDPNGFAENDTTVILEPGDTLYAQASAATSITLTLYGLELS